MEAPARLRTGGNLPEDWIGATNTPHGEDVLELSVLPDGSLLRDAVQADPVAWPGRRTWRGSAPTPSR